ncbi:hypothetical protein U1Q18_045702 [Sarracenia purpurea var. burkii]
MFARVLGMTEKVPAKGTIKLVETLVSQQASLEKEVVDEECLKKIEVLERRFANKLRTLYLIDKCASASGSDDQKNSNEPNPKNNSLQIRKLGRSSFDGNARNFRDWYAQVITVIDENDGIGIPTPLEKLLQLRSYLTGDVTAAVADRKIKQF